MGALLELFTQLSLLLALALCAGWGMALARVWRTASALRRLMTLTACAPSFQVV